LDFTLIPFVVRRDGRPDSPKARAFMKLAVERLHASPALN
jgi:hypothetical protein